jgi:hypothetical protein
MYDHGVMTLEDWNAVKVLRGDGHNWGDKKILDRKVVRLLDDFLLAQGLFDAVVTSGTGGDHATNSLHYQGKALDVMLPGTLRRRLPALYALLLHAGFGGVGIYADWKLSRNMPPIGGFHVDSRKIKDDHVATWLKARAVGPGYQAASAENMKKAFT